jgi:hypothetical protein
VSLRQLDDNHLQSLIEGGRRLLERITAEEIDPRSVNLAYQEWYSAALELMGQLLPGRLEEFASLYRSAGGSATGAFSIAAILSAPTASSERGPGLSEIFDPAVPRRSFLHLFDYQLAILASARSLQPTAPLQPREVALLLGALAAAHRLLKAGHRRVAGVLAGLVLRHYLESEADRCALGVITKMSLVELVGGLGSSGLLEAPRWRMLNRLAWLGDRCGQANRRAPTRAQVRRLIGGTEEALLGTLS